MDNPNPTYAVFMGFAKEPRWFIANKCDASEYGDDMRAGQVWSETDTTTFIAYCGSEVISILLDSFIPQPSTTTSQ